VARQRLGSLEGGRPFYSSSVIPVGWEEEDSLRVGWRLKEPDLPTSRKRRGGRL